MVSGRGGGDANNYARNYALSDAVKDSDEGLMEGSVEQPGPGTGIIITGGLRRLRRGTAGYQEVESKHTGILRPTCPQNAICIFR